MKEEVKVKIQDEIKKCSEDIDVIEKNREVNAGEFRSMFEAIVNRQYVCLSNIEEILDEV